ncbi:MAG TPA: DUF6152 family protein [Gammaproteobacteria bacterium]|nr:DUF6152 family protein [Gammaproteobacteria bacterium]
MKRAALSCTLIGALFAAVALPAFAHHGTLVSYDRDKQWTREVTVTRFNYANPHPQIFFDVTDEKGTVVHWAGELLPNPAGLLRVGWTKSRSLQALAPGTKINITIAPARAGGLVGLVVRIKNLDGADIVSDSVPYPDTAAAPAPQP